ncbi:hypothetical protein [Gordonia soli]|uniref:Uncharacterized protein n=1 Tax=Gordonia soli NBRC 108243 TaxID=1223545 RepID=M0QJC4_9ACTN|nr:hypothetical protein [Gordonia soli]GAC68554.1 hypothetical protein GS4_16_00840 [Gordonia soli NBRC 108243]
MTFPPPGQGPNTFATPPPPPTPARPASAVVSGLLAVIFAILVAAYTAVTWSQIVGGGNWPIGEILTGISHSGSAALSTLLLCWVLSPPISALLLIGSIASFFSRVARVCSVLLILPTILMLLGFTGPYLALGPYWFDGDSDAGLFTAAWGFPLFLVICAVVTAAALAVASRSPAPPRTVSSAVVTGHYTPISPSAPLHLQ